jgi:hypothetical protein
MLCQLHDTKDVKGLINFSPRHSTVNDVRGSGGTGPHIPDMSLKEPGS